MVRFPNTPKRATLSGGVLEMRLRRVLLMAALMFWPMLVLADACEFRTACPYDGQIATLTPSVRYVSGKEFHKYSHLGIVNGHTEKHEFWVQCERKN
jgi:hypothetical protein